MGWETIFAGITILGAGVIRGYSGFGFALICALTLSLVFPPATVTPIILCLDVGASLWLLYKVRLQVDWSGLRRIGLGAVITLPLGTLALVVIPINTMRIFISLVVICLCFALLWQKKQIRAKSQIVAIGVGMCSGFLTGVAAIGGPPVVLFYLSSDRPIAVSRASMIAFFLMVDTLALGSCLYYGLITRQVISLSLGLLIPLGMGIWMGNFLFHRFSNEAVFRKQVIILLLILGVISMVKAGLFP